MWEIDYGSPVMDQDSHNGRSPSITASIRKLMPGRYSNFFMFFLMILPYWFLSSQMFNLLILMLISKCIIHLCKWTMISVGPRKRVDKIFNYL